MLLGSSPAKQPKKPSCLSVCRGLFDFESLTREGGSACCLSETMAWRQLLKGKCSGVVMKESFLQLVLVSYTVLHAGEVGSRHYK
jgi:hypothetical protein